MGTICSSHKSLFIDFLSTRPTRLGEPPRVSLLLWSRGGLVMSSLPPPSFSRWGWNTDSTNHLPCSLSPARKRNGMSFCFYLIDMEGPLLEAHNTKVHNSHHAYQDALVASQQWGFWGWGHLLTCGSVGREDCWLVYFLLLRKPHCLQKQYRRLSCLWSSLDFNPYSQLDSSDRLNPWNTSTEHSQLLKMIILKFNSTSIALLTMLEGGG